MKTAAFGMLVTLLGLGGSAWPQAAPPTAVPSGFAAVVVSVVGDVDASGVGLPPNTRARATLALRNVTRLVANSANVQLTLACANGGSQLLSGSFKAVLNRAGAPSNCAVMLEVGNAFAVSSPDGGDAGKASLEGGPVAAISDHTQFGMTVPPGNANDTEVFVIEGDAQVRRGDERLTLAGGKQYLARTAEVSDVPESRYRTLAASLARVDLVSAGAAVNPAAQQALQESYYNALRKPEDAAARRALTQQYETLKISESQITRYNVQRDRALNRAATRVQLQPPVQQQQQQ